MRFIKKVSSTPLDQTEGHIIDSFNTSDDHTTNAPSLNAVETSVVMKPTILWEGTPTQSNITLNESIANYSYIEVFFHTNDGLGYRGSQKVIVNSSGSTVLSLQFFHPVSGNYYIKAREIQISGKQLTTIWSKEIYSGGMSDSNYIYITQVLGYK